MDDSDARRRLERLREQTVAGIAGREAELAGLMAASRDSNADDEHDPEGATIGFERAQASSVAEGMRMRLAEIDAALGRLDAGTYGRCERCGRAIAPARLAARPFATLCLDCQAEAGR
ncbi:TraR/DksA C4-type zinc finger protein [Rarobacter faecitabidus]|uniref:TraR/DksA family transcriptional regulator n=1 Tax=Rarobacter faecitabidus TaxID=13243 RepID=A0A542ZTF6_RARFA|nr:TraR/DksA C4-type zinc finger protein [Rarobacter faecitabidus]TQL63577.1 TraR/DksA family transcriptional regulator [Rarobacter faecitabidus]